MPAPAGRPSSRDKILDAASVLVAEHGVQHLTIEAAAAKAGITKAGLIYHFKTRDELLAALVERMLTELDVLSRVSSFAGGNKALPRAHVQEQVRSTFDMPEHQKRLLSNMLAAASAHPHLLPPVQALYQRDFEALGQGPKAGLTLVLALALEGLLLLELLQLHQLPATQRTALRKALLDMANELP